MTICIEVSDTVAFRVSGHINSATGTAQPFDFKLTADRLDTDAIAAAFEDTSVNTTEFLVRVVRDWSGVRAPNGDTVPYSAEALRRLCKIPGVSAVAFKTYLAEVGAKEKN